MHKRKHGRVRARGVASHLRDGAQLITGLSVENLSMGGAFIRTASPLPNGAPVVIDLVKPGMKRSIRLTGRVASAVPVGKTLDAKHVPGMGIEFDELPPDVAQRLNELLVALAGEPSALDPDAPDYLPALEPSPAIELEPAPPVVVPEGAKLMVQVRGLLMELGELQQKVSTLEGENATLRAEVDRLTAWIDATSGKRPPKAR